jgi:hypothetical protein
LLTPEAPPENSHPLTSGLSLEQEHKKRMEVAITAFSRQRGRMYKYI